MKKFKLFTAVLAVLFLSCCLTSELHASQPFGGGDKWEIKSANVPTSLKLGSHKFAIKIKIKNAGDEKTTGQSIKVKVKETYNGITENEEFTLTPSKTAPGKTTTLNILCTNENFWTPFASNAGEKTLSFTFDTISWTETNITKDVKVKVK
jgi:hypothetical protein